MKITNKTIGCLIAIVLISGLHYYATFGSVYEVGYCSRCEVPPMEATFETGIARIFAILFWVILGTCLLDNVMKFSINIPTPFANLRATMKAKKELNQAITDRYVQMGETRDRGEFNALHDEVTKLEARLEGI